MLATITQHSLPASLIVPVILLLSLPALSIYHKRTHPIQTLADCVVLLYVTVLHLSLVIVVSTLKPLHLYHIEHIKSNLIHVNKQFSCVVLVCFCHAFVITPPPT